jgi:GNAT superfamily N-acetyltransferase
MPLFVAADTDLEEIAALVNDAYRGDGARRGWTDESDYVDGQRTSALALRRDLALATGATLMAFRDAPASAWLGCVWLEPAEAGVWYLGMLTVRPDQQDRRLGRAILDASEQLARERGARRIRITVVNLRDALIAWYERRGYALTGETQPFPYEDARFGVPRRADLVFVVLEKPL